jgi:hypothetical protein
MHPNGKAIYTKTIRFHEEKILLAYNQISKQKITKENCFIIMK